ncbi:MAG: electron transfer flavoprotein subunit beta/FixA family protein, partial [Planctomycetes bacterium]|nr:electron transfer flavoprotein subunit beta/FixA family protein [Planctomycetota bacterium]
MRILSVLKQVPDSSAVLKVLPDRSGLDQTGLKYVPDPFDEYGVELAIQLREKRSDVSEIVVLTLGPDKAAEALRVALAMGADSAIHINDPALLSNNELFAADIIAQAIKKDGDGFDLILCGKYNIDLDSGAVGPALAEFLDWPHVGAVTGLEVSQDGKRFTARRRIEGAEEELDSRDHPELPFMEGYVSLYMDRPEWGGHNTRFSSDIRSPDVLNGTWPLAISSQGDPGDITIFPKLEGTLPADVQVVLLDHISREPIDITIPDKPIIIHRRTEEFPHQMTAIAGTPDYIAKKIEKILSTLPAEFSLAQNYPPIFYETFDDPIAIQNNGETTGISDSIVFVEGVLGNAATLTGSKKLCYPMLDNFDLYQGTVEFWVKSPAANHLRYFDIGGLGSANSWGIFKNRD